MCSEGAASRSWCMTRGAEPPAEPPPRAGHSIVYNVMYPRAGGVETRISVTLDGPQVECRCSAPPGRPCAPPPALVRCSVPVAFERMRTRIRHPNTVGFSLPVTLKLLSGGASVVSVACTTPACGCALMHTRHTLDRVGDTVRVDYWPDARHTAAFALAVSATPAEPGAPVWQIGRLRVNVVYIDSAGKRVHPSE